MPDPIKVNLTVEAVITADRIAKVTGWIPNGRDYSVSTEWTDDNRHVLIRLEVTEITTDQAQDILHEIGEDGRA